MDQTLEKPKHLGRIIVLLGVLLSLYFVIAAANDWYHSYGWVDIPQHFLFGIFSGLTFYWLVFKFPGAVKLEERRLLIALLLIAWATFLGVAWEFLEFSRDFILIDYLKQNVLPAQLSNADTMGDLLNDLLGALFLAIWMRLRYDKA